MLKNLEYFLFLVFLCKLWADFSHKVLKYEASSGIKILLKENNYY